MLYIAEYSSNATGRYSCNGSSPNKPSSNAKDVPKPEPNKSVYFIQSDTSAQKRLWSKSWSVFLLCNRWRWHWQITPYEVRPHRGLKDTLQTSESVRSDMFMPTVLLTTFTGTAAFNISGKKHSILSVLAVGDFYQLPPFGKAKPLCVFEEHILDFWQNHFCCKAPIKETQIG